MSQKCPKGNVNGDSGRLYKQKAVVRRKARTEDIDTDPSCVVRASGVRCRLVSASGGWSCNGWNKLDS